MHVQVTSAFPTQGCREFGAYPRRLGAQGGGPPWTGYTHILIHTLQNTDVEMPVHVIGLGDDLCTMRLGSNHC